MLKSLIVSEPSIRLKIGSDTNTHVTLNTIDYVVWTCAVPALCTHSTSLQTFRKTLVTFKNHVSIDTV
jgi:hypothetical protein